MMRGWIVLCLGVLVGCGGADFDDAELTVFMVDPHDTSSHMGDEIDFEAVAVNGVGAPVAFGTSYQWEVRRARDMALIAAFPGALNQADINARDDYVVGLLVTEPGGRWGTARANFRVSRTVATIRSPDSYQTIAAGLPFDFEVSAETDVGDLQQVTITIVNQVTGTQDFLQTVPVGSDSYSDTMAVTLPAGDYLMHMSVITSSPDASAVDRVPFRVGG